MSKVKSFREKKKDQISSIENVNQFLFELISSKTV